MLCMGFQIPWEVEVTVCWVPTQGSLGYLCRGVNHLLLSPLLPLWQFTSVLKSTLLWGRLQKDDKSFSWTSPSEYSGKCVPVVLVQRIYILHHCSKKCQRRKRELCAPLRVRGLCTAFTLNSGDPMLLLSGKGNTSTCSSIGDRNHEPSTLQDSSRILSI